MTVASPDFAPDYAVVDSGAQGRAVLVFPFIGQKLLIGPDAVLPCAQDLQDMGSPLRTFRFGTFGGRDCVMKVWPAGLTVPPQLTVGDYRSLWGQWPPGCLAALVRARQLAVWILDHRCCGACGQAMDLSRSEIACVCPACGHKAYPRISPVAIGLVCKGDEILLARSPHFAPGMYSALAGFVEAGESAEECLRREIREEAGIEVGNIRYFGSQSWPYPHSLMLGFLADYQGGELVAQEKEIEDIGWFCFDSLPILPHPSSLARRMIEAVRTAIAPRP
ncbi:MAG: NAD(+) diphosphatase [Azoarcus sp.]|jgi:NAD+ diphosphatase|nr:NAD(+) diphosphatase [Azoarcus sp.]